MILFAIACALGPAAAQLLISSVPLEAKSACSEFIAMGQDTVYSLPKGRQVELSYKPDLTVTGYALPVSRTLEITLSEPAYSTSVRSDQAGLFTTDLPLADGDPSKTIVAHGPLADRAVVHAYYLRRQAPYAPPPVQRDILMTLSPEQASVTYTIVYTAGQLSHPDLRDLESGKLGGTLFVKRIFYPARYQGFGRDEFSTLSARPDFVVDGITRTVSVYGTLAAEPEQPRYTPHNIANLLAVTPQGAQPRRAPTRFVVHLDRVSLRTHPAPSPDLETEHRLAWLDPEETIRIDFDRYAETPPGLAFFARA